MPGMVPFLVAVRFLRHLGVQYGDALVWVELQDGSSCVCGCPPMGMESLVKPEYWTVHGRSITTNHFLKNSQCDSNLGCMCVDEGYHPSMSSFYTPCLSLACDVNSFHQQSGMPGYSKPDGQRTERTLPHAKDAFHCAQRDTEQ